MLDVKGLTKSYAVPNGRLDVLKGIDLNIRSSETVALMGDSGCGKSTLLHLIAGLDTADSGEISLNGDDLTKLDEGQLATIRRTKTSIVFQQFNLIPNLNVRKNISFEANLAGRHDLEWEDVLIDRLALSGTLTQYPEDLSGGQQQRVAIARSLAAKPKLILADEPTGNLDEENSDKVLKLMLELTKASNSALIMVTHSSRLADMLGKQYRLSSGKLA